MFKLKFGIMWTAIIVLIFIPSIVIFIGLSANPDFPGAFPPEARLFLIPFALFLFLFLAIGIFFICSGLRQVKKDKETDQYGIPTHGKITAIVPSGAYVNGTPELKARIHAYVPTENRVRVFEEIVGFAPSPYDEGDFLDLLYHENDVNIVRKIPQDSVPYSVMDKLENEQPVQMLDENENNY